MQFFDDSLHPENMEKVVITVAPYGPEWMPEDFPEDIPLTMDEQIQKAVECYEAGATVLHLHVRELDGKGSKRLSKFNELIAGVRAAVPDMIIQVGGSISFAPESDGEAAKWLSDDTRHMLAELTPKPDQVTVAINTTQMNIMELLYPEYLEGTSLANPLYQAAYSEMTVPAGPAWVAEHLKRLMANGIQPRAPGAPGCLQRSAEPDLDRHRRRFRRPEPVQLLQLHPPRAGRLHLDLRVAAEERAAVQHHVDGHGDAPARRQ
jgi:hypothetical protein